MKELSETFLNAVNEPNGVRYFARLRVFRNRNYFEEADLLGTVTSLTKPAGIHYSDSLPQSAYYDAENNHLINIVNDNGSLQIFVDGVANAVPAQLQNAFDPVSRPSVVWPHIFAMGPGPAYNLQAIEINPTNLYNSGQNAVVSVNTSGLTGYPCAIHAIDDSQIIVLYIDEGGVRAQYRWLDGISWQADTMPHRFMFPATIWTQEDAPKLNFSAACLQSDDATIGIYLTAPSGEVLGCMYDLVNARWGDVFVAIPKDLTAFYITSAYRDPLTKRVFLALQFERTDEHRTTTVYNLLMWSDDGKHFSMDRNAIISSCGRQLVMAHTPDGFAYADGGQYIVTPKHYSAYGENAESITIVDATASISGDSGLSASVLIADGMHQYYNQPLLVEGSIVKMDIGTHAADGSIQWVNGWETLVIDQKINHMKSRKITLELVQEAVWRNEVTTYPMYMEIQSRQSVRDDADQLDNLYPAPQSAGNPSPLFVDFWLASNGFTEGGMYSKEHGDAGFVDFETDDIKKRMGLIDYPVLPPLPCELHIYGWSRIGKPDTNPNTDIEVSSASRNDDFVPSLTIKRDGAEMTIDIPKTSAVNGISYPPDELEPLPRRTTPGTCPVVYSLTEDDGLRAGDQIVSFKIRAQSDTKTTCLVERVEIPAVTMYVSSSESRTLEKTITTPAAEAVSLISYHGIDPTVNLYTPEQLAPFKWRINADMLSDTDGIGLYLYFRADMTDKWPAGYTTDNPAFYVTATWKYTRVQDDATYPCDFLTLKGHGTTLTVGADEYYDWPNMSVPSGVAFPFYNDPSKSEWTGTVGYSGNGWTFDSWSTGKVAWMFEIDPDLDSRTTVDHIFDMELIGMSVWAGDDLNGPFTEFKIFEASASGSTTTEPARDLSYKVKGVPAVLFSETPGYAFDFKVWAEYSLEGQNSWGGVVGLANDAKNFIGARCDPTRAQIFVCRNGLNTVLAELAGQDYASVAMLFEHRGGNFTLRFRDGVKWGAVALSYSWKETDGPMLIDPLVSHVGAYTYIDTPRFPITGFYSEDSTVIPLRPGYYLNSLDDFPASGRVEINGNKYDYTAVGVHAQQGRGPFSPCNSGTWEAHANPSTGETHGGNACEITMFDWTGQRTEWDGYLLASSTGYGWNVDDIEHRVWITTGGQVVWLRNRIRVYGPDVNPDNSVSVADKIWLTSGLTGVTIAEGDPTVHGEGTWCYLDLQNKITLRTFGASSGYSDATIRDLLQAICGWTGVRPVFPGDTQYGDLVLGATPVPSNVGAAIERTGEYDGMDIRFTLQELTGAQQMQVITNHSLKENMSNTRIVFNANANKIEVSLVCGDDISKPEETFIWDGPDMGRVRVLLHRKFATVYFDENWVYTFSTSYADYSSPDTVSFVANFAPTITDVFVAELYDWREAVYIDIDSSPASAIESIIQERPIVQMGQPDGSLAFYYEPISRPQLAWSGQFVREHDIRYGSSPQAASDTIVYYADVRVLTDTAAARDVGLNTRILRVPNLDNGAMRMAKIVNLRARQSREQHDLSARFHPALQPGDRFDISYTLPGAQQAVTESLIVESCSYQFTSSNNEMSVRGRSAFEIFSPSPRE